MRHDKPLRLAGLLLLFAQLLACTVETQDVSPQVSITDIVSRAGTSIAFPSQTFVNIADP